MPTQCREKSVWRVLIACFAALFFFSQPLHAEVTATYSASLNASALPVGQTGAIAVVVHIALGLHAQSHQPLQDTLIPFTVSADPNPNLEFLDPIYPPAKTLNSPFLGPQSVYTGRVIVYIPVRIKPTAAPGPVTLTGKLTWQACNYNACFAPERNRPFSISTQIVPASQPTTPQNSDLFIGFDTRVFAQGAAPALPPPAAAGSSVDFFGHVFTIGATSTGLALAVALAVGILFNLMPCVLPVVPLKAIGFLEVSRNNRARCFFLGVVFSLGMIFCFLVLAMLIVVLHKVTWGQQFSNGAFIWFIVVILLLFAAGMFGLFDVVLPQSVYRVTLSHNSIGGNFLFGIFTAVLSTPCTAPMFAGLLAWSLTQPLALGVASIVTVGVGMALPYLVLSAFPNLVQWVPHTGPWSAVLKQMMAFLLIAAAVYFGAGRLIAGSEFIWAVFAVVAVAMLFLIVRTIQLSKSPAPILASLLTSAAVIAASLFVTFRLTGGLAWKPFSGQAFTDARATGNPVLVEFTANWCGNCLALEASVYRDPQTAAAIAKDHVILLRADLTSADTQAPAWQMVNKLNPGGGIPLTAIYGPKQLNPIKLTSLYTTQNLLDALTRATGPETSPRAFDSHRLPPIVR